MSEQLFINHNCNEQQFNNLLETLLKLREDITAANNNTINLINQSISYLIRIYANNSAQQVNY